MAQAKTPSSTQDRFIMAAARAYCAEHILLDLLGERYEDLPDDLVKPLYDRMEKAKRLALLRDARTIGGVLAKARMVEAGELFDVDPLIVSTIRDLLAVAAALPVVLPHPVVTAVEKSAPKAVRFKAVCK